MSFLAPLFLLGALAVSLPIIFHFIRRTTRERKVFGSLIFLRASPPRLTQRNRIEHLLLLLLRCAVICLLAFGFARPFFKEAMPAPMGSAGKRVLLLVDASASMRRANLWSDARSKADTLVRNAAPGDQLALFTFDRQLNPLFTFDQWNAAPMGERAALLTRRLAETSPGWRATQLGSSLQQAAELLADSSGKGLASRGRIELITDFQEGSHLESLQGYDWPKGVEVSLNVLKPRNPNNASLQLVSDSDDSEAKGSPAVRVRISNTAGSKGEQFKIGWEGSENSGFAGKPIDVYVPAGQSRISSVPAPSQGSFDRIRLRGDDEEFDNLVFAKPPSAVRLSVTYIGNDAENNPRQALYFLKRAFQETRRQAVHVTAHRPGELIPVAEVQGSCLFVVADPLSNESEQALRSQVAAGKTLLIIPKASMQPTLNHLLDAENLKIEEVHPGNYALFSEIDFRHPIFAPFADPRFSDFTKIHFWKYTRLDAAGIPHARVLARFDNGDPALVEVPLAAGRILILSSSWDPESSQLALSSKFVPLLYAVLEGSGAPAPLPAQYHVGDIVPIEALTGAAGVAPSVRLPDGSEVRLGGMEKSFSKTDLPGIYTLTVDGVSKNFVVNLDPSESRTTPLPLDDLERFGVPAFQLAETGAAETARKARLQNAELENRQKLWRFFIVGTLIVLLVESWLAGRTARRTSISAKMATT